MESLKVIYIIFIFEIFSVFSFKLNPMKRLTFLVILLCSMYQGWAQVPVWSQDIAPILYNHCTSCHHSGGIAPFSLIGYTNAVSFSTPMRADVISKKMPPWPPDPNYAHLAHERVLSASEINKIVQWIDGGTPSGDMSLAPPDPVYSTAGTLPGTPDLVLTIPTYTSTATTGDIYQCFAIPSGLTADRYITAFEALPGNASIVHHVLVYADTTGVCAGLDAASAGPGYPNFGGVGSSSASLIGAWVPGTAPMTYPNGFGVRIPSRSDIVLQIHYPAGTTGLRDSTQVRFYFSRASTIRDVYIAPVLNHSSNIDSTLFIPANTVKRFSENLYAPIDFSLLGVAPHMHLLGKKIKVYSVNTAGDTNKIIDVPKWDFHWQGFYSLPRIRKVTVASHIRAEAEFDNTTANPENPSSPPRDVSLGEGTRDEMMLVYFIFTAYQPGDENIVIDSGLLSVPKDFMKYYRGNQILAMSPNPAQSDLLLKCYLEESSEIQVTLIDAVGKLVETLYVPEQMSAGYHALKLKLGAVAPGTYTLRLQCKGQVLSSTLVISK